MALKFVIKTSVGLLAFCFLVHNVAADWEKSSEDDVSRWYLDLAATEKQHNVPQFWAIEDRKALQGSDGWRSSRAQLEYDCANSLRRVLMLYLYSQPLATGDAFFWIDKPGRWHPIPGDRGSQKRRAAVCLRP